LGDRRSRCGGGLTLNALHPLCELRELGDKLPLVLLRRTAKALDPKTEVPSQAVSCCAGLIQANGQIGYGRL